MVGRKIFWGACAALAVFVIQVPPAWTASVLELMEQGKQASLRGDKWAAIAAFNQIAEDTTVTATLRAEAIARRGGAYIDLQQCDKALQSFDESLKIDPASPVAHLGTGICRILEKNYEAAITALDTVIKSYPNFSMAYERRGAAKGQMGRPDQAIEDFTTAIRLQPHYPLAYMNRGQAYANKDEKEKALSDLNESLKQDPSSAETLFRRGAVHLDMGNIDLAEADLNESIRRNSTISVAFYIRGAMHERRGKIEEARQDYTKAYDLGGRRSDLFSAMQRVGLSVPEIAPSDPLPPLARSSASPPVAVTSTPAAAASPYESAAPAKSGTASGLVASAQEILTQLGYKPGKSNGVADDRTVEAVKLYQKDNGLPQTSEVTPALLDHLAARAVASKGASGTTTSGSTKTGFSGQAIPKPRAGNDLDAKDIYAKLSRSVYTLVAAKNAADFKTQTEQNQGSAVAVSNNFVVTNCHVIRDRSFLLLVRGNETISVVLDKSDEASDRCWLKAEKPILEPVEGVRPATMLTIGEKAYTIGSPHGLDRSLGEGLISGVRQKSGMTIVQTTAPISPGSSGGGLFDAKGNLIGITTFKLTQAEGLNFAIAADQYWQ